MHFILKIFHFLGLALIFPIVCKGQHIAVNVTGEYSKVFDLNDELNGDLNFKGLHSTGEINVTAITDRRSSLAVNITVLSFGNSEDCSRGCGLEEKFCLFFLTSTCKTLLQGSQKDTETGSGPGTTEGCTSWHHTTTTSKQIYSGTSSLMTGWCASSWARTLRTLSTTLAYGRTHNTVRKESNEFSRFDIQSEVTCM